MYDQSVDILDPKATIQQEHAIWQEKLYKGLWTCYHESY